MPATPSATRSGCCRRTTDAPHDRRTDACAPRSARNARRTRREPLGYFSRTPRYIQTVHRRGFRFIGPIVSSAPARATSVTSAAASEAVTWAATPHLVGRDADLAMLTLRLERAL